MLDLDVSKWDVYEPLECECIDARIGSSYTAGGQKAVIILTLRNHASAREMVRFFNAKKIKGANYTVPRNGGFAKLYRITLGKNPKRKFSKAQQLINHLIGEIFICNYEFAQTEKTTYFRVTEIVPSTPQYSENWLEDGRLVKRRTALKNHASKIPSKALNNKKHIGNDLETDGQHYGNQLETQKFEKTQHDWDQGAVASHRYIQHTRIDTYGDDLDDGKYISVEVSNSNVAHERIIRYWHKPGETYEEYLDRVIDTSIDGDYLHEQEIKKKRETN